MKKELTMFTGEDQGALRLYINDEIVALIHYSLEKGRIRKRGFINGTHRDNNTYQNQDITTLIRKEANSISKNHGWNIIN